MLNQALLFLLILFHIPSFSIAKSKPSNQLLRGSSISVKDTSKSDGSILVSPDQTFTCGFYGSGANAYWLAIWFTKSKDKTVVWTANRDNPINGHGSSLTLRKDGALVLTDLDGSLTWQTNTTNTNANSAELLNSGNLVLKNSEGEILWKSFDYPTDTLLPNQFFTKNMRLISPLSPQLFASGYYNFFYDNDNVLKMMYNGEYTSMYWPNINVPYVFQNGRSPYNSSCIASFDDSGSFSASDQMAFDASDKGVGIKRRLKIDHDGNLRLYSLNNLTGLWTITWQAVIYQCDFHGLCGRNGICAYTPDPKCSCPPHFEPADVNDWSKGCTPKFTRSCSDSEFVPLVHTDYYGFDMNRTTGTTFEECKQLCLGDCRCQAFSYKLTGEARCFTKGALFDGFRTNDFAGVIYLRIPKMVENLQPLKTNVSVLGCSTTGEFNVLALNTTYNSHTQKFKWAYWYSFASGIGAIELIILVAGWFFLFRKHGISNLLEDGYRAISSQFRSFRYGELKKATGGFKIVLGQGGFGVVYKGVLADGRAVAVKKLRDVSQGEEECWAEVSIIGRINHLNLARMWGFCAEAKRRLLVYEYVEHGSLDKHLFPSSSILNTEFLGWKERFKIALGTAKGLAYLHHECLEWVIHCDVKPENILLDIDFEPKISDFGLAKLSQRGGTGSQEFTRIRGTKGYMAPEWTTNIPITSKVDVYSYGVVILEIVRGVRMSSLCVGKEEEITQLASFVRFMKTKVASTEEEFAWVDDLVDQRLEGEFNRKQAAVMMEVGLSCIDDDRNKRPTMESVAQVLADCQSVIIFFCSFFFIF